MKIPGIDLTTDESRKKLRLLSRITGGAVFLALTRACVYATLHNESLILSTGDIEVAAFVVFPFLMLGGLYGYMISMVSFTVCFICSLLFDMDNTFKMAALLVPTLLFSMFSQHFWFNSRKKTFLAAAITLASTSIVELACLSILADDSYSVIDIRGYLHMTFRYFARDALVILFSAFVLHFFFTRTPDLCKVPFPLGVAYTKAFQEDSTIQRDLRKTRIGMKITSIIIGVELILGLFVGVFMVALFPDMKAMMIANMEDDRAAAPSRYESEAAAASGEGSAEDALSEGEVSVSDEAQSEEESSSGDELQTLEGALTSEEELLASKMEALRYRFDMKALNYDIKMVLMMLCVGVPLASFAHYYVKIAIGMPLGMMSDFMYEYANAPDDKKLEVGKKADRIRVRSRDEIRVVNDSMAATVRSVEEYIGRLNEEQELEKELEVAQKASEAKSSFLSNMSHEIRTPINAVLGMNEMILRESKEPQTLEYAQNVKSAGNSLLGIVNDILDFSKIEAGKMDILPVEYHLSSMVNDLMNMISVKAEDKGLKLEVNVDEHIPNKLFGDEIRVKQCVTNILTNAVKYTEEGTVTMNVTFRQAEDDNIYLGFQVVDTGIGIKEEDINKLFSPFERIEEIRNRTIEGTGLGMSIVKKLLAMMDTKLTVKSVYGEGSDFSFEVLQKVLDRDEIGDFKEKYKEYLRSLEKYHEAFHAPNAEILVVDDTAMNLTVVKGLLKSTLIRVDTAESGKETLVKVTKKRYDTIFIDHRMPEMDGLETLAAMKSLEGNLNAGVPCIALTANAGAGARDEYLAAGFDDYLAKPVNGTELENMLKKYLPADKVEVVSEPVPGAGTGNGKAEGQGGNENITGSGAAGSGEGNGPDGAGADDFTGKLTGIDLAEAERNCGSREVLMDVVKEFLLTIDPKADNIEKFAADRDFRNYTVAVHALKSSARLIGAMELSGKAAYLEECGNTENLSEIEEKTPELLALFRSYKEHLAAAGEADEDDDKPEIPEDELDGAFSDMKELLEAYDFDTADGIMKMLSDYRIPDGRRDKYNKVKELMASVDRDSLLEIL